MSGLNPSEISSVLKEKISGLDLKAETKKKEPSLMFLMELSEYMGWAMLCMASL